MPYRVDLFSIFIFLGIIQGVFLLFFFLSKENRQREVNRFHAILLFSIVMCTLEIFLGYTGYMVHVLYLVDFSEPFALLIGPAFYLLVVSLARGPVPKKLYYHFIVPAVYVITELPFLLLPQDAKYNSYVGDFHPELAYRSVELPWSEKFLVVTDFHSELTIISLAIYGVLGLLEVIRAFREKRESIWKPQHPVLKTMRTGTIQILSVVVLIVVIKTFNERDLGDHLLAAYVGVTIYFTSFSVIRQSGFFKQAPLNEQQKYKTSGLSAEQQQQIANRLTALMAEKKPFLQSQFSLPDLAQQLNVSVHTLSQVINETMKKSFFEMTAEYRVEEAKQLLKDQPNIKVEEIAEQVGYNSKSSFNTAFKKITGQTPSEFRGKA